MKNLALYILGIAFITITLTSCGTTKQGCGLTSDADKIEQSTITPTTTVASVK